MAVLAFTFLFNLLCAMVPCDPYHSPPVAVSSKGELLSPRDPRGISRVGIHYPEPVVVTKSGALQGYFMTVLGGKKIYAFEGVRYAQPPKMFQAPEPVKPWKGMRQAMKPGRECIQTHPLRGYRVTGKNDCLFLNVYTPMIGNGNLNNTSLPVIIFIHGGCYMFGSGHEYGPSYLLHGKDVILVTLNYRLGVLGFLSTGDEENPGNWGLKDQALAIQWVVDNIQAFGGDAKRITLMGNSAGGASVHIHLLSNVTKHLINNAVSFSGTAFQHWTLFTQHQARKWAEWFGRIMGCSSNQGSQVLMTCLKKMNPNFLVGKQYDLFDFIYLPPVHMRPAIEPDLPGAVITASPSELYESGQVAKIPFIATQTTEEAEIYTMVMTNGGVYRLIARNLRVAAPSVLDYRRVAKNVTEVTEKLIRFYLKGGDVRKARPEQLTAIGTDRYFITGIHKGLESHSKLAPTYSYIFGYKNRFGIASSIWGQDYKDFGVPHTEDQAYLLNSTFWFDSIKDTTHPAFKVVNLLTSTMVNFATMSKPLYTDETGQDHDIWEPIKDPLNMKYLQIDKDVKMIGDPYKERIQFWNDLSTNIDDAYPYPSAS